MPSGLSEQQTEDIKVETKWTEAALFLTLTDVPVYIVHC